MLSRTDQSHRLPVAIIGAGPIGLTAAAHLTAAGANVIILEKAPAVAAAVSSWAHVRLFSTWQEVVDDLCVALLRRHGWQSPPADVSPTGAEFIRHYLAPLAAVPAVAASIRLGREVVAVSRADQSKREAIKRTKTAFCLDIRSQNGKETRLLARAVLDASGTCGGPGPLGADGLFALGERNARERIYYGIPDVLTRDRRAFAGRRIAVVGSGYSARDTLLDLLALRQQAPNTDVTWISRRELSRVRVQPAIHAEASTDRYAPLHTALADGRIRHVPMRLHTVIEARDGLALVGEGSVVSPIDRVVSATGFRPNLEMLRELRLQFDSRFEAPTALAPLIDPSRYSCGTVPPHGVSELTHLEPDFYVVGIKSYGRAPTFLLRAGYEQVRSVAAVLTGDAARRPALLQSFAGCVA